MRSAAAQCAVAERHGRNTVKIIDAHIHANMDDTRSAFDARELLERMQSIGVSGGCVFSGAPYANGLGDGQIQPAQKRLDTVLRCCEGYRDRLFPLLWVHPDEDGICQIVQQAAERGIMGFKIICNNFYVYEDKSLRLLEQIAKTGRPVMFHSGILWDSTVSSKYNRPLHWEALCKLPGLRFSLAHCSWPWYDEAIALYGKFLTNHMAHPEENSEMFFDTTPGTPVPYRRDLYTKLLGCGYDVEHNILWGTDCNAVGYNGAWTKKWLQLDNAIMDELQTPPETRELIFHKNMERFFGLSKEEHVHQPLHSDGS